MTEGKRYCKRELSGSNVDRVQIVSVTIDLGGLCVCVGPREEDRLCVQNGFNTVDPLSRTNLFIERRDSEESVWTVAALASCHSLCTCVCVCECVWRGIIVTHVTRSAVSCGVQSGCAAGSSERQPGHLTA